MDDKKTKLIKQVLSERYTDSRYEQRLKLFPYDKSLIDNVVKKVEKRIKNNKKSFVIYGEPQCGKTELMIHICCKLFDLGVDMIVVLMHDITALQMQNFNKRFAKEEHFGCKAMTDENFADLEDSDRHSKDGQKFLVVGRKNGRRLEALINNSRKIKNRVVIDDEADFATPNYNIQKKVKKLGDSPSPINEYVTDLVGEGFWIGVTATPAKCDLNNTLNNNSQDSIIYKSGEGYTGQDYFFPRNPKDIKNEQRYILNVIKDQDNSNDKELINAVYRFMIRAAYLNISKIGKDGYDPKDPDKYSMIVHSHTKKEIHENDRKKVAQIESNLRGSDEMASKVYSEIYELIVKDKKINSEKAREIISFIDKNRNNIKLYLFNSEKSIDQNMEALEPEFLFTFIFGGYCLSRGVTFNNLLSLFFLRGAKIFQQGTYIQLARHFGYRKNFAKFFELTVPKENWEKWYECFFHHRQMVAMLEKGEPIHLVSPKVKPVDLRSIDTSTVIMPRDNKSMGFGKFKLTDEIEEYFTSKDLNDFEKIAQFKNNFKLDNAVFPDIFLDEIIAESKIKNFSGVEIILPKRYSGIRDIIRSESLNEEEKEAIQRNRGGLGPSTNEKTNHNAFCWITPFKNSITNMARIIYVRNIKIDYYENTLNRNELVSTSGIEQLDKGSL